jgi:hypothetical protein
MPYLCCLKFLRQYVCHCNKWTRSTSQTTYFEHIFAPSALQFPSLALPSKAEISCLTGTNYVHIIQAIQLMLWNGCAIAQAVVRRLPTAAARVGAQIRSCGIYSGQSDTGASFSWYFGFPCRVSFHQLLHIHHHLSTFCCILAAFSV